MGTSCATNLPRPLALRLGRLPELLDEDSGPALLDVVVYDGFGELVSPPELPGRFAFAALEEYSSAGLYGAQTRCYNPTPGRWLEDDPIGFAAGDSNLYRFVSTEPGGILLNDKGGRPCATPQ